MERELVVDDRTYCCSGILTWLCIIEHKLTIFANHSDNSTEEVAWQIVQSIEIILVTCYFDDGE